jgi:hypothetical protein
MTERSLVVKSKDKTKLLSTLVALSLTLASAIIIGTTVMPSEMVNGQNATGQNATGQMENASAIDQVDTDVLKTLAAPGYANKYDLMVDGKSVPINYNIIGGQLVGMLSNPDRHALYLALNPQKDGGAMEVQVPRNFIDAKTAENKDKDFVVLMDGDRIGGEQGGICVGDCPNIFNSFKQTEGNSQDRVLTLVFGPESRFVEILGDKGS